MDWIKDLKDEFGENEPITFEEIWGVLANYSIQRVYQLLDKAIKENLIVRFENGIYYIPTKTIFGLSKISPEKVLYRKYISNNREIFGYYSGLALKNIYNLTSQVPNTIEIVTNKEASRVREIYVGKQLVRLRKSRIPINRENVKYLSLLDLFTRFNLKELSDYENKILKNIIQENRLTFRDLIKYSYAYPAKTIKNLMTSELNNAFAQ
ncbi:MAG: hypothetical protein PHG90_05690 [Clostridia bacterium]|jgi:hypothetical protein|nr:hypothetical protein [Clostridia bacterium]NLT19164.1 hypothetical protein [Clostridiales bacterium]OQC15453.1 MAG: hypothetical protein BWX72_00988 [Firmicutes bacterium ADurb.Bin080]